jgi:carboxyl-terminal processing protease
MTPEQHDISSEDRQKTIQSREQGRVFRLLSALLVMVVGFCLGYVLRDFSGINALPSHTIQEDTEAPASGVVLGNRVNEVATQLEEHAYAPSDIDTATEATIEALLESTGDRHAAYYTDYEYGSLQKKSQGSYVGIGISLDDYRDKAVVIRVYEGSPAENAGIQAGDFIVGVDDDVRDSMTAKEIVDAISGEPGTDVRVSWRRPTSLDDPGGEMMDAVMTRETIKIPNVSHRLDGEVGYISISSFDGSPDEDVRGAIEELESQGAQGYVVDLRNNLGGLLDQAVKVTSLFQSSGNVVEVASRGDGTARFDVTGEAMTDKPLTVLVNGYSASASEIMAASLQQNGRATLIGTKTFGKGSVQTVTPLSFGGAVKFTIAHYHTPDGSDIDGVGITPDIVVDMQPTLIGIGDDDVQYRDAVEHCRRQIADVSEKAA